MAINSTLSDYTQARHTRRERVSSAMDGKLKSIHGVWIPATHAGMTILDCVMMKSDKVESTCINKVKNFTIQSKESVNGYLAVQTREDFYGKLSL